MKPYYHITPYMRSNINKNPMRMISKYLYNHAVRKPFSDRVGYTMQLCCPICHSAVLSATLWLAAAFDPSQELQSGSVK
jgi:hypothetical protein